MIKIVKKTIHKKLLINRDRDRKGTQSLPYVIKEKTKIT